MKKKNALDIPGSFAQISKAMLQELFRFLFWRLFPDPRIGEEYCHADSATDPWNEHFYKVIDRKGGWYRIRGRGGYEESITKSRLICCYRLTSPIAKPIEDEKEWRPF